MKRISKILTVVVLVATMVIGLTGCTGGQKTVATIDGQKISESLYKTCLWFTQKGLEDILPNIWNMDTVVKGKTPEEFAKSQTFASISLYVTAREKAEQLGIKFTREEKKAIKKEAKVLYEKNKEMAKAYGIKEKDFVDYITYGKQIDKVTEVLAESYEPNEEEIAKKVQEIESQGIQSATMIHVLISNQDENGNELPNTEELKQKAAEVLKRAEAGEDMRVLAQEYSDDESVSDNEGVYTCTTGKLDENLEKVVFNPANVGKVYPEIVETEFGYEIVKVEALDELNDDQIKEKAIEEIKQSFAANELTTISEQLTVEKTSLYDSIGIMTLDSNKNE